MRKQEKLQNSRNESLGRKETGRGHRWLRNAIQRKSVLRSGPVADEESLQKKKRSSLRPRSKQVGPTCKTKDPGLLRNRQDSGTVFDSAGNRTANQKTFIKNSPQTFLEKATKHFHKNLPGASPLQMLIGKNFNVGRQRTNRHNFTAFGDRHRPATLSNEKRHVKGDPANSECSSF